MFFKNLSLTIRASEVNVDIITIINNFNSSKKYFKSQKTGEVFQNMNVN